MFLSGCITSPEDFPADAVRITPPAIYREWATKVEQCSGLNVPYGNIEFYMVPDVATFQTETYGEVVAFWDQPANRHRIVISEQYLLHPLPVQHELLHTVLSRPGHPPEWFEDRCRLTWRTWTGV